MRTNRQWVAVANKRSYITVGCLCGILKGFLLCVAVYMKPLQARAECVEGISVLFNNHGKIQPKTRCLWIFVLWLHRFLALVIDEFMVASANQISTLTHWESAVQRQG